MIKDEIKIRCETKDDYASIKLVNDLAFGQETESELIAKLRRRREYVSKLSLVALLGDEIIGHILFYPVDIETGSLKHEILSLAPMSVLPDFQNLGIGGELVRKGLAEAMQQGYDAVVVLGHPEYYPRFGFELASKYNIKAPWEVPDEAFMAIELKEGFLQSVSGTVIFPKEFDAAV